MGHLEHELTKERPEIWPFPGVRNLLEHAQTDAERTLIQADQALSELVPQWLQQGADPEQLWALLENYGAVALEQASEEIDKEGK